MKNIRFTIGFAVCGFLLSFTAGLFSHSGFGHKLLLAVIFGAVFGALALFIQFLMEGVLSVDGQTVSAESAVDTAPKTGGVVDITVQDEELPIEENSPQFFVGNNHQMLNKSDYSENGNTISGFSKQPESPVNDIDTIHELDQTDSGKEIPEVADSSVSEEGFVPVSLQENAENLSGTEAVKPVTIKPAADFDDTEDVQNLENDTLDELPDLKDLKTSGSDDNIIEDSDFSKAGTTKQNDEKADGKDAAVMARAISTVLAKDKEN
ncbi:MAG: hypothetical protein M0P01_11415 [Treponema sp.]|nr:hypothetical protein [Treponema sp.]